MKKQILVIHGGSFFEKYDEYVSYLVGKEVTLEKLLKKIGKNLGEVLGEDYQVVMPQMPNAQNARYLEWKIWLEKNHTIT